MKKNFKIVLMVLLLTIFDNSVNAIDYSDDNLAIGTFFSVKYFNNGDKEVDNRVALYATTNGSDFMYLGETGITGRDARVLFYNDVFYMATTTGASASGGYSFNIFKSKDLVNWTNDTVYPYAHHVDTDFVVNNKYGLRSNTWAPKWVVDGNKVYLVVISSRFDEDGARYYYIKGDELEQNNVEYDNSLTLLTEKGVLVKESAVLDDGKAQYVNAKNDQLYYKRDDKNNIYNLQGEVLEYDGKGVYRDNTNNCTLDIRNDNKLSCNGSNSINLTVKVKKEAVISDNKLVQLTCPFYSPNYPVLDMYIAEVNFGSDSNQKDINYQNISFSEFKKIKLSGFSQNISTRYGFLFGFIEKNESNTGYKYAMYLKIDPYGSMQRWVANSLYDEWVQVDDGFYPSSYQEVSSNNFIAVDNYDLDNRYICNSVERSVHGGRASTAIPISDYDDMHLYKKHFEGAFAATFNGKKYFYSDHYSAENEVNADQSDMSIDEKRLNHYGIYYAILDFNNNSGYTDLTYVGDHIRFSVFRKVNVYNNEIRPSDINNNAIRNGCVYRANSSDMSKFKDIVSNASKFNLYYQVYSTTDESKKIIVIKSNHAIRNSNVDSWYNDGWRYVTDIKSDSTANSLNNELVTHFSKFDSKKEISAPYSAKEIYLYKIVDSDSVVDLAVSDYKDEKKSITINLKSESNENGEFVIVDSNESNTSDNSNSVVDVNNTFSSSSYIVFGIIVLVCGFFVLLLYKIKKNN